MARSKTKKAGTKQTTEQTSTAETPFTDVRETRGDQAGPATAGQSGDTQGLSGVEEATSESVKELVEEGQYFEAAVVSGIENAPNADVSEVRTSQVAEDDVPLEYLETNVDEPPRPPRKDRP
jgi:hypothetical protein